MRRIQRESKQRLAVKINLFGTKGVFWEVRTRILLWYVLILSFIFVASIPTFREVLYQRINTRVYREIVEKMETFEELISQGTNVGNNTADNREVTEAVNRLRKADKRLIKPPASKEELQEFFDAFLGSQLPDDDTFLIAIVDGKFRKSSPRARPKELDRNSQLIRDWGKHTQPKQGEKVIPGSTVGSILYLTKPVKINGEIKGVFVIAHASAGEHGEVAEAVSVIVQVSSVILVVALLLAWLASGQLLIPLRLLIQTARSISESDLNQRIPIQGKGELAELAITFNEMMDRLQAAFTSQRNFINDAGHELRTPVTIIRGHLELMGDDPKEVQETTALVLDELDRMNRFVNDMILLAKAERPDFLLLETVDVRFFTEELFAKIQALAERNWQLDCTAQGKIVGDRQRLTQTIMNLAQNATQHTQTTDIIGLGSAIKNGKIYFWVRDTGEGIAATDQKRIFERFARAANSRRRSEGAGLGLSIVQAIAEAHGGQVRLTSQLGCGAKFIIILPLQPPQESIINSQ